MRRQLLILFIAIALAGTVDALSVKMSNITVEGVIYCRCNLNGYVARVDASPLSGIVVSLKCVFSDYRSVVNATTDSTGYFRVSTMMVTKYVGHSCSVYVLSSPLSHCVVPPELALSGKGSNIIYERKEQGVGSLYSAGLMLIGPASSASCQA